MTRALTAALAVALLPTSLARAQPETSAPLESAETEDERMLTLQARVEELEKALQARQPRVTLGGYVDVGFFVPQGDGTGYIQDLGPRAARHFPVYGDEFAWVFLGDLLSTAVNTRGEPADLGNPPGIDRLDSIASRGAPSFIANEANLTLRATVAPSALATASVNFAPRGGLDFRLGDSFDLDLAQLEWMLGANRQTSIFVGKTEGVVGFEYRERKSSRRFGITPSLIARYTTGTPVGLKAFYRAQLPAAWSALSLNVAATNGGTFVEALQPAEISLTGEPVVSGRLGYELNLPSLELKLGASGLYGGRNDQGDRDTRQQALGGDARLFVAGVSLAAEYVHVDEDPGPAADKVTGAGLQTLPSGFHARGFYLFASYDLPLTAGPLRKATIYARAEQRHAWFQGHAAITVQRLTAGARVDLWDLLALKLEYLANREAEGAPPVANNVTAASAVFSF
jgi:hypothetical protein